MRSATKSGKGKDSKYLEWIRNLPCCICALYGTKQAKPTEAAHVGDRGLSQKCPDREAIPLCEWHHREGPHAQHKIGRKFFSLHAIDKWALIAELNKNYDGNWARSGK